MRRKANRAGSRTPDKELIREPHTQAQAQQPLSTAGLPATNACELVLAFYGRKPVEELELESDARVFGRLISWGPPSRSKPAR
ncbi:hypothetical protein LX88_005198 [Lentzea californiensis]|nr:hypothetical protein [Lentzea californiensis]